MGGVRLLFILGVELVVQIYEVVVEIIVQIVVIVVVEIIVVELVIIQLVFVVPLLVVFEIVVVIQVVFEFFIFRIGIIRYLLRQPRISLPAVKETPSGLQHGAHSRTLLVVRQKRVRASPLVTTSYDRSHSRIFSAIVWIAA